MRRPPVGFGGAQTIGLPIRRLEGGLQVLIEFLVGVVEERSVPVQKGLRFHARLVAQQSADLPERQCLFTVGLCDERFGRTSREIPPPRPQLASTILRK